MIATDVETTHEAAIVPLSRLDRTVEKRRSYNSPYLISSNLISSELSGTGCAVKRPSSTWPRPIRRDGATYIVPIGRSHVELSRFTLLLGSDEMRSDEMRRVI